MKAKDYAQQLRDSLLEAIRAWQFEDYTPSPEGSWSPSRLIYCPIRRELEKIEPPPFEYKMPAIVGSIMHEVIEKLLKTKEPWDDELLIEQTLQRTVSCDGKDILIVGRPDVVLKRRGILLDFKTRTNTIDFQFESEEGYQQERDKLWATLSNSPSIHYLWQLWIYKWLLEGNGIRVNAMGLVYLTRADIVVSLFIPTGKGLQLISQEGVKIDPLKEHPDLKLKVKSPEDLICELIKKQANRAPIHKWECRYCWYHKVGKCPYWNPGRDADGQET